MKSKFLRQLKDWNENGEIVRIDDFAKYRKPAISEFESDKSLKGTIVIQTFLC